MRERTVTGIYTHQHRGTLAAVRSCMYNDNKARAGYRIVSGSIQSRVTVRCGGARKESREIRREKSDDNDDFLALRNVRYRFGTDR